MDVCKNTQGHHYDVIKGFNRHNALPSSASAASFICMRAYIRIKIVAQVEKFFNGGQNSVPVRLLSLTGIGHNPFKVVLRVQASQESLAMIKFMVKNSISIIFVYSLLSPPGESVWAGMQEVKASGL